MEEKKQDEMQRLKVAAYIRVSTQREEQEESFEQQEKYFHTLISSRPEWEYVGIYSDYGKSGTKKNGRIGFQRLMRHCEEGRIQRILCKSISRFARNTADLLEAIRILNRKQISIFFEKENLDTADRFNEFVMTVLATISQEESRSISENMKAGFRMRFAQGDALFKPIYGYRVLKSIDQHGNKIKEIVINPEEANVVRYIYRRTAEGAAYTQIARELNQQLIPYPHNRNLSRGRKGEIESPDCGWTGGRIAAILKTERYTGDCLCQKTYCQDVITHKNCKNTGEVPQYMIKNHHPAIINREDYDKVQTLLKSRMRNTQRPAVSYALSGRVVCGTCGRVYHYIRGTKEYEIWKCPLSAKKNHTNLVCDEPEIYNLQLYRGVRKGFAERFHFIEYLNQETEEEEKKNFLEEMQRRFEQPLFGDTIESERAFLKKQCDLTRKLERHAARQLQNAERILRTAAVQIQADEDEENFLGKKPEDNAIEHLRETCRKCRLDYDSSLASLLEAEEKLKKMEEYWIQYEKDDIYRKEALEWMRTLPKGKEGLIKFMKEMAENYLKAWVIKIIVRSPFQFQIQWYDNSVSDVELPDNLENVHDIRKYKAKGWIW